MMILFNVICIIATFLNLALNEFIMLRTTSLYFLSFFLIQNINAQQFGTLKDSCDGKVYKTVKIGEQEWMAENLNVSKFRNGDPIPQAKTFEEWVTAYYDQTPVWCYYNNDSTNEKVYGKLYNYFAVNDPRGIAPNGYHIPSDSEWTILSNFLDGENSSREWNPARFISERLKNTSGWNNYIRMVSRICTNCATWNSKYKRKVACPYCKDTRKVLVPNIRDGNGNNSSGFSGLPGGRCQFNYKFDGIGEMGVWWSATENKNYTAWCFGLSYKSSLFYRDDDNKNTGYSVRCIK
jgi:uncharacterized protein (TIGR02145 family)